MKPVLGILGIAMVLGGTMFGIANWYLTEIYLEQINWEGPLMIFNRATWLLNILGFGLGTALIGVAALLRSDD